MQSSRHLARSKSNKPTNTRPSHSKRTITTSRTKKPFKKTSSLTKSKSPLFFSSRPLSSATAPITPSQPDVQIVSQREPVAQMMLYVNDSDFLAFNERRNTQYNAVSPSFGLRLFPTNNNYKKSIPQSLLKSEQTLLNVAGQIQTLSGIAPDFVSFSTTDHVYAALYFTPNRPHELFKTHYTNLGLVTEAIDAGAANGALSGVPPPNIQNLPPNGQNTGQNGPNNGQNTVNNAPHTPLVNFSKMKSPTVPVPFFNNAVLAAGGAVSPSDLDHVKSEMRMEKSDFLKTIGKMFGYGYKANTKRAPMGQQLASTTPALYNPKMINIPLHYHTPLFDLVQVKDLQCHISYRQSTIDQYPQLQQFIQTRSSIWNEQYPELANAGAKNNENGKNNVNPWKTMTFSLTPNRLMLEANDEDKESVSTKLLAAVAAAYMTAYIGIELYEQYTFPLAQEANPGLTLKQFRSTNPLLIGTDAHVASDISDLQRTRSGLKGQIMRYESSLEGNETSFGQRYTAFKEGSIGVADVFNPFLKMVVTPAPDGVAAGSNGVAALDGDEKH